MRFPLIPALLCAALFAAPTTAQKMRGMAFSGPRHSTTLAMFASDFSVGHMAIVAHGQPTWKEAYADFDGLIAKYKGQINRLGSNWWTTLQSSTTLELGGVAIPAGSYVVAIAIDETGKKFSLALLDATKAMKTGAMPFQPAKWTPDVTVPMTFHKDAAEQPVEKMTMTFEADAETAGKGTFTIAWGPHTLTAAAMLQMAN
jgi:hypothetical protein